jgi:hypothetical protein
MPDRRKIKGETVRLTDLLPVEGSLQAGSPTLNDIDFVDCIVLGPAVLAPVDSSFEVVGLSEPIDDVLWDLKMDDVAVGALVVQNCTFSDCRFQKIGIAGPKHITNWFRAVVGKA